MKTYAVFALVAVFVVSLGGYAAYRYAGIISEFSFDLTASLGHYDSRISRLKKSCLSKTKTYCFDAVSAEASWTSEFDSSGSEKLILGCVAGDQRACRHSSALERVGTTAGDLNVWARPERFGEIETGEGDRWPRVLFLRDKQSLVQLKDLAYQALVLKVNRKVDLVCAKAVEFLSGMTCVTHGAQQTSLALSRVSALIEQGEKIVPAQEHRKSPLLRFWQGFNFKRSDFVGSSDKIKQNHNLHQEEKALWSILLAREWDILLTFNVFSVFSGIPSHEYYHGIFFESENYRHKVDKIISRNPLDLLAVRSFVKSIYKTTDTYVLNNEIQAYALQDDHSYRVNPEWKKSTDILAVELMKVLSQEPRWSTVVGEKSFEN